MASFADKADFEVRWLPFQLNPDAPREGANKLQYYYEKFGPDRVAQFMPRMEQVFAEIGAKYSLGGLTGNTMDGHRLLTWSEQFGPAAQNALAEECFKAYFSEERYIGDRAVLLDCVGKAGLDVAAAARVLDDPQAFAAETRALMQRGRGVGGVPYFVVEKRYKMSGAQPSEVFEELFDQLLAGK
ncbi:hypothetical protein HYH03_017648 [Edaphochlamys debaryana]|uniref:DSBA-like thioredoxin domain-containing protein n=1 Tax=Edaphochlamys debaryana TaxID=47281 RepID=A0A835XHI6_9CHLO|nr:hypothetical protein HYH03_017648 [Edaphochlamys debaryana]|eukprot:KAG2483465.1 hypothetical protein HYH03_017648 [Edaphochlamys debaryana]